MVLSGRSGWALQLPLLFFWVSAVCLIGALAALMAELGWLSVGASVLAVGFTAFSLSELRFIRVSRNALVLRTPYSTKHLPLDQVALGIHVQPNARGGPTYTIYAQTREASFDLGTTLTRKGAENLRTRLGAHLLAGRRSEITAERSQGLVSKKETEQAEQLRQAQEVVQQYYASGRAKTVILWFILIVVVCLLGMGAFIWWLS